MNNALVPETIAPAPAVEQKPARKPRQAWSQVEVASLVTAFHAPKAPGSADFSERDTSKLIELGLIAKPTKVALTEQQKSDIDGLLSQLLDDMEEPRRTLCMRYAIKELTSALPKRVAKA